ncbi:M15 family metallopeptidase [Aquimarina litoralis]|uniref:M15 family metallopeptidase n=1 Tax=Aquimarina litoralis TaxID=584605 RepID=UPI001C58E76A|nr:M15 family metallopeptidase [Aquimarina litoralis]MBW1296439.1 peptidase M15 [Aquimarina litoralis]
MNKKTRNRLLIGVAIVGLVWALYQPIQKAVWDLVSEMRIQELHPRIRNDVRKFLNEAEKKGIFLRVTDGVRTFTEQDELYAQGRTAPGDIVTNARGGESYHNYGLAVDVVPMVNGFPDYNTDWTPIAEIGKRLGFFWGGDFTSIDDKPHFQKSFGFSTSQLLAMVNNDQLKNGFVIV